MHENLGFTFVTLKLDGLNQHFNGADTQDSAPETYEFIDQVALDHGEGEYLVEVSEPSLYMYLIKINDDLLSLYVNLRSPRCRHAHCLRRGRHTESRRSDAHTDTPETISHSDCHTE